jgi:hypothetical protein
LKRYCVILSLLLPLAAAACGQTIITTSPPAEPKTPYHGLATFQAPRFGPRPVVGAPYYGEEISQHEQTLANGTQIDETKMLRKIWRDSQGRTRIERELVVNPSSKAAPAIIQITDPVAGYIYTLDTARRIAHRVVAPPPPGGPQTGNPDRMPIRVAGRTRTAGSLGGTFTGPAVRQTTDAQGHQVTIEELGTKAIDGILVEGTRRTTVYPTGSQGNDRPLKVIVESWWSPDVKVMMLSTTDNPRSGVTTVKTTNLNTQEPDPELFLLPVGYTIVDETRPFTITWGAEPGSQRR